MESRLIFLYLAMHVETGGDGDREPSHLLDYGKNFYLSRSDIEINSDINEVSDPLLPRKAACEVLSSSYRKPTQVGRVNILRRLREPSLRNSAN